eukprot:scaffold267808_cov25-Tisochrysis_lutea.AAC.4
MNDGWEAAHEPRIGAHEPRHGFGVAREHAAQRGAVVLELGEQRAQRLICKRVAAVAVLGARESVCLVEEEAAAHRGRHHILHLRTCPTDVSCCNSPCARNQRARSRAAVVLPAPGLPVSTTLRHPSSRRGSPPCWTYSTFARSWARKSLSALIPVSAVSSASTSRRCSSSEARPCLESRPRSASVTVSVDESSLPIGNCAFLEEMARCASSRARCALRIAMTSRGHVAMSALSSERTLRPEPSE